MRLMKYVENANPGDGTTAISVGDDRPTINLGGMGEMTDQEIANANAMGHVLVEVDDGGLSKMKVDALDAKAAKLGVSFEEDDSKDDKISKLRQRLAQGPEDPSEAAIGGGAAAVGGTTVGASGGPTGTSTSTGGTTP